MTSIDAPKPPKPAGPSLRLSVVLIIAGVALAVPTFIAGMVPIVRAVTTSTRHAVPDTFRLHLGKGTYMVFENTGASSPFSSGSSVTITPQDVTVTADDGTSVAVFERSSVRETLTSNGDSFVGVVRFTTPSAGEYAIRVQNVQPTTVLVARPLTDTLRRVVAWFLLAGAGGLAFVTGIILLIVGSLRRNRARNAFAYAAPVPPGWHPDPGGSGRWRYWDGYQWTEHLQ